MVFIVMGKSSCPYLPLIVNLAIKNIGNLIRTAQSRLLKVKNQAILQNNCENVWWLDIYVVPLQSVEPTKPLCDAQIGGSFFIYKNL